MANVYHIYRIYGDPSYVAFYTLHITCMAKSTRAFVNRAICNNVYMYICEKHIFLELN